MCPKGTKNPLDNALKALVADRAITRVEREEIKKLIDYRNIIAHRMHDLLVDISPERVARERMMFLPDRVVKYDYNAVERLGTSIGYWLGSTGHTIMCAH